METTKYQGWTNYQTWCVNLWINDDEQSYRYWKQAGVRAVTEASQDSSLEEKSCSQKEVAVRRLSELLQEDFETCELLDSTNVHSDLLRNALNAVNWREIAESLLEDAPSDDKGADREETNSPDDVLFSLGRLVCTPEAARLLSCDEMAKAIGRHLRGDWGSVDDVDALENILAVEAGFRIFSVYESQDQTRFWVITEADRSVTTILLPTEY